MDLIDREQAIAEMHLAFGARPAIHEQVVNILDGLPSAEKMGKWEYIGGYGYQYRCSACIMCAEHKTRYCPNCGSRMW